MADGRAKAMEISHPVWSSAAPTEVTVEEARESLSFGTSPKVQFKAGAPRVWGSPPPLVLYHLYTRLGIARKE